MARFKKIDPRLWGDERIQDFGPQPPHPITLFIYLLTGPHNSTLPGAFVGTIEGFAALLKWSLTDTKTALDQLLTSSRPRPARRSTGPMVQFDPKSSLFVIPKAFKYNLPESVNVLKSWANQFDELPECAIKHAYIKKIKDFLLAYRPEWGKAFSRFTSGDPESLPHSLSKDGSEALFNQEPEHEHEQEQEPEHDGEQEPAEGKPTPLPPPSHTPPAALDSPRPYVEKPKDPQPADPSLATLSDDELRETLKDACAKLGLKPDRIFNLQKTRRDLEITLRAFRMQLARKNRGTPEPSSELTPDPPPPPTLPSPQEIRDNVTDLRNRLRNGPNS